MLLSGNLTTYMTPTAPDLLDFTVDRIVTPSTVSSLGVKGWASVRRSARPRQS